MISDTRQHDGITVVDIEGRFDALTTPQIKAELHALIEGGAKNLILNLEKMDFIDSAGLGALVSCLRRTAAEGGELRLAEVPAFSRSIFELTRLTRVFDVSQTEEQAIRSIKEGKEEG